MENIHHKQPVDFIFRCWWGLSPRMGAVAQVSQCSGHSKATLRALGLSPNKATFSWCNGSQDVALFCLTQPWFIFNPQARCGLSVEHPRPGTQAKLKFSQHVLCSPFSASKLSAPLRNRAFPCSHSLSTYT